MDDSILLPPGTVLAGQYEIQGVLGKPGGFGITYLALDRRLGVRVAVKEFFPRTHAHRVRQGLGIRPNTTEDVDSFEAGKRRFLGEAQLLARFNHPNIVRVKNFFEANQTAYLVMDYLDGAPLWRFFEASDGRLPAETAYAVARAVLDALRPLHAAGIVHRDVDPHNIYVTRQNDIVLLDFGAARVAEAAEGGATRSVVLKPGYAPYEQYSSNGRLGPWTDLYAVGATLYRMLTGTVPPEATSRMIDDTLVPLAEAAPDTPAGLARAVTWALALRPDQRPQTVDEFARVLFDAMPPAVVPDDDTVDELWSRPVPAYGAARTAAFESPQPLSAPPAASLVEEPPSYDVDTLDEPPPSRSHVGRWALVVVLISVLGFGLAAAFRNGVLGRLGIGGPRAADDSFVVSEGQALDADVLANDIDPAGQGLRIVDTSTPEGGRLRSTGGVLRYIPRDGFFGEDRFRYTMTDAEGRMDSASVVVVVERSAARLRHDELAGSLYGPVRERLETLRLWLTQQTLDPASVAWETGTTARECVIGEGSSSGGALVLRLSSPTCASEAPSVWPSDAEDSLKVEAETDGGRASDVGSASGRTGLSLTQGVVQADLYREGAGSGSVTLTLDAERAAYALTLDGETYRLMRLARPEGSGADEVRRGTLPWNGSRLHVSFVVTDDAVSLFLGNSGVARVRGAGSLSGVLAEAVGAGATYRIDGLSAFDADDRGRLLDTTSL